MYAPLVTKEITNMTEAKCVTPESRRYLEKNKDVVHDPKDGSVSVSASKEDWQVSWNWMNEKTVVVKFFKMSFKKINV